MAPAPAGRRGPVSSSVSGAAAQTLSADEALHNEVVRVARKPVATVGFVAWALVICGAVFAFVGNVLWLTILSMVLILLGMLGLVISHLLRHPERAIERLAKRRAMLDERLRED